MNEPLKNSLRAACSFAKVFMEAADAELLGASPDRRREAALELEAALIDIKGSEDEQICRCHHRYCIHTDTGICLIDGCHCYEFTSVVKVVTISD